jgi:hypothetical protein
MSFDTILLINLSPPESTFLRNLIGQMAPQANLITVPAIEEAATEDSLGLRTLALVVFCPDPREKKPGRTVHRIKHLVEHSVPVLLLISPDQTSTIKGYLRSGVDEYWILPMDSVVFPQRLRIMLEWGRSSLGDESFQRNANQLPHAPRLTGWVRLKESVQHLFRRTLGRKKLVSELIAPFAGRWNRIRRLGFGGFGEVWLVQEESGGMLGVAKIPHSAKMNSVFIREAAILKRLEDHSNCVELKEVIEENGKVILIEEYVEGETLQDLLDQGMETIVKERAFLDLLDFLAYAHERRIMHRDIKPENIIINPSGTCKLLDFGTGKDLMFKTTSSTVVGSRPYMAPEQISGKSSIASDVWALGVLLYALATGLLPFYDENQKKLMDMILECDPEPPRQVEPELPEALEAIILKCLRKDPDLRFRDAGELKHYLLEVFPTFGNGHTLPPV